MQPLARERTRAVSRPIGFVIQSASASKMRRGGTASSSESRPDCSTSSIERRRADERVGLEQERRHRQPRCRQPQQIGERGARAGQPIGFRRPAELAQHRRRVEDVSSRAIRPLVLDETGDVDVLEASEARAVRIDEVHALVARPRGERLSLDPSTDERRDFVAARPALESKRA